MKPIPGFPGYYTTDLGGIVSTKYRSPRMLKPYQTNGGYQVVTLMSGDEKRRFTVHRLIAKAWRVNTENKPCVNHLDGDKTNNHPSNLEWCTHSENTVHMYANGLHPRGQGVKTLTSKVEAE